jgi:hypothetical protein
MSEIQFTMEEFDKGLWIRVVAWPEDEVFALSKREKGVKKQPGPSFVTLVKQGYPVSLRGTVMGYEVAEKSFVCLFTQGNNHRTARSILTRQMT